MTFLFEVQNDKSVEAIPSPVSGTVTAVLVSEGTVAHVGDVIVEIATEGGSHAPAAAAPAAPQTSSSSGTCSSNRVPAASNPGKLGISNAFSSSIYVKRR